MRVLIACEKSGIVREAFARRGHDAWSCDLLPTEIPGQHIQGDVRDVLHEPWDQIIAHPDCSYITNSGVQWLMAKDDGGPVLKGARRWAAMWEACEFFRLFINHPCPRIAIENPIPQKYALAWIGKRYSQLVQPYMFGEPESKATCLWLKNLPPLQPTIIIPKSERRQSCWKMGPSETRKADRSRTFQGVANAFAETWG